MSVNRLAPKQDQLGRRCVWDCSACNYTLFSLPQDADRWQSWLDKHGCPQCAAKAMVRRTDVKIIPWTDGDDSN